MIFCGIDWGCRFIKIVLVDQDKAVLTKTTLDAIYDEPIDINETLDKLFLNLKLSYNPKTPIAITGAGRNFIKSTFLSISETMAMAKAAHCLYPSVRTIIDVGAETTTIVRVAGDGSIKDTIYNDRCSSGSGIFLESMSKVLKISVSKMGEVYFFSQKKIVMSSQCTVFAESEVISLMHSGVDVNDIVRAIIDSVAQRVSSLVRRTGLEKDVLLIGGLSENKGFIQSLKEFLGIDFLMVTDLSPYLNAYGCAISLVEKIQQVNT